MRRFLNSALLLGVCLFACPVNAQDDVLNEMIHYMPACSRYATSCHGSHRPAKKIVVSLSRQKLFGYEDKTLVYEFDAITGRTGHDTVVGHFTIFKKVKDYYSKTYNAPMFYSSFFSGDGKAIHATSLATTRSYLKYMGLSFLGSHGCVGLTEENASRIFAWAPIGTPVEITP